jgi:histidine triad (HIT) family protein
MSQCIFCKIRDGQLPAKVVHRDEVCLVLEDIHPQAPTHLLVIPLKHVPTVNELGVEDREMVGHLHLTAAKMARQRGIADSGYRLVFNTHDNAGQTVFHIHLHVIGGRPLGWPPG